MKTHIIAARRFAVCCLCAAAWPLPHACAESGGATGNPVTFERLRERFDAALKTAETNENARKYADVRNDIFTYAVRQVNAMGKLGDRAALPFLEEKSLSTNNWSLIRERAAVAYVKVADLDESVEFMRKIFAINDNKGYWRSTVTPLFLQKVEAAINNHAITDGTLQRALSVLVAYAQFPANSQEADYVDGFLVKHCAGYQTSIQRMSMARNISDGGNELERNHFIPIKESVEALPKKQRVDLRDRFPNLPPLPQDKASGSLLKVGLILGAMAVLAAACTAGRVIGRGRSGRKATGRTGS